MTDDLNKRREEIRKLHAEMNREYSQDNCIVYYSLSAQLFPALDAALTAAEADNARLREDNATLTQRVGELEKIVAKLPKTADEVPVVPGMVIYDPCGHPFQPMNPHGIECWSSECHDNSWCGYVREVGREYAYSKCYSTREAALAASAAKGEGR